MRVKRGERDVIARNGVDIDTELDTLQRNTGDPAQSAAKVQDLVDAGVLRQDSTGQVITQAKTISGAQKLQSFLRGR